ncbi:MAG: hypothetical protein H6732_14150 [Alphaproteobacteria bacterium]|nr:hypothetical protein [Alphaproteobacteria bacterium]
MRTLIRALGLLLIWTLVVEIVLRIALGAMGVHWPRMGLSCAPHLPPLRTLAGPGPPFEAALAHHPVLGWVNRPRSVLENGLQVTVDANGFRDLGGPDPTDASRTVVVVGDSFSFGTDLADEDVFLAHVQAALPDVAIVDLGVPIYGPDQMWLSYREQGRALAPDLVVMALLGVDLFRAEHDLIAFPKPRFVLRDGALALRGVPAPDRATTRAVSLFRPRLLDVGLVLAQAVTGPVSSDDPALQRAIVQGFVDEVRGDGVEVLVLGLPDGSVEDDDLAWFPKVCGDPEVCMAIDPGFAAARQAGVDVLGPWNHWSPEGSRRVADAVMAAVGDRLAGRPRVAPE